MQQCIIFDDPNSDNLLPFTYTRPTAEIRIGITTITEKWARYFTITGFQTREYLQAKYPKPSSPVALYINGAVIPSAKMADAIGKLKPGQALTRNNTVIAVKKTDMAELSHTAPLESVVEFPDEIIYIEHVWHIFQHNATVLRDDFQNITNGRKSQALSPSNHFLHPENIFLEEGANVEMATLNASNGPIYIGKNAEVMEGAIIRGPFALCEGSSVKMGAKIIGDSTVGPHSKVGGEISNSVLFGYSNKGHDGFLGNSVLGEWCNLGADTNTSNLKNNYAKVKLWHYPSGRFINTGLQFCGLIMGDHSKCGINTMFNTGTVVGVSANIFGSGFPRNFIPSFSWGGAGGFSIYQVPKALETARIVMERRHIELSAIDKEIFQTIFKQTEQYR